MNKTKGLPRLILLEWLKYVVANGLRINDEAFSLYRNWIRHI